MRRVLEPQPADTATLEWISAGASLGVSAADARSLTGWQLQREAAALAARLQQYFAPRSVVGSIADNSPSWLLLDLALQAAGMVHVPLPSFFSAEQTKHAIRASSMNALLCPQTELADRLGFDAVAMRDLDAFGAPLNCYSGATHPPPEPLARLPETVCKLTFTSGTTGSPKAVLLSLARQLETARSLAQATGDIGIRRHLCLLPLPVLLENVAGAYTALLTGAECVVPSLIAVGMTGAADFDPVRCLATIEREGADSLILLPQMLAGLADALESAQREIRLDNLKFVAVGGAHTPPTLIARARALGLPVYEGYGLSECASVTTLNLPRADRIGTVGRALPGVTLRLAEGGEIQVRGRAFEGYLGEPFRPAEAEAWLATGDLGAVDDDGFVSIIGRKKHQLVTSFGRNVSPEWPEGRLTAHPAILQAAVFGEARPFLYAVLVVSQSVDDADIDAHVRAVNDDLPDYARISAWVRAQDPFTMQNGLITANGRLRRAQIEHRYRAAVSAIYDVHDARPGIPSALPSNH
jgi:long-subunit acyl-CoA synthetase (AMP-forming)